MVSVVFVLLALVFGYAAYRVAEHKGRRPGPWMVAGVFFGPFALLPLLLLRSRRRWWSR